MDMQPSYPSILQSVKNQMLVSVEVVLRFSPALRDLEANCWIITRFLGPPPNMSLSDACFRGSIELLDWIWNSSCTSVEDRAPRWSLTNYLRSEPLYYSCQFSYSLVVSARQGNLEIVKWLFAHFSNCEVGAGVACQAAKHGHLPVLEFLWSYSEETTNENMPSYKKQMVDGGAAAVNSCCGNARNFVEWDNGVILAAAEQGHFDIVRWLHKNTPYDMYEDRIYGLAIKFILRAGDDELVKLLLLPGRCVLDYADDCPRVELTEWMLDCGYLRRDASLAMNAIRNLAASGRMDLMQQIVQLHSPIHEQYVRRWSSTWLDALIRACDAGALPAVQWLVMQQRIPRNQYCEDIVQAAAKNGHHAVVQYLCEQKIVDRYVQSLYSAIRSGHVKCVEVLLTQLLWSNDHIFVIDYAAKQGNLAMVKFLLDFIPQEAVAESNQKNLVAADAWEDQPRGLLAAAAASGNLELVKWVQVNHPEANWTNAINSAAMNGHLRVVKWLQGDRTTTFTEAAMDAAVFRGYLPLVKWIHSNGFTGYVLDAVDDAARQDHLDVVKWFYANRPERCTARTIEDITCNGPLRVADWLHTNYPECVPTTLDGGILHTLHLCKFEMLLFVDARCPQCFTPEFVTKMKQHFESFGWVEELRWMNERFAGVKETK